MPEKVHAKSSPETLAKVQRQGPEALHHRLLGRTDAQGGKKIALRGGDGTEAHLPNPPLPLLGCRAGRGVWAGAAQPAVPGGGGGSDPNIHGSK